MSRVFVYQSVSFFPFKLQRRWKSYYPRLKTSTMFPSISQARSNIHDETKCKSSKLMLKHGLIQGSVAGTFHLLPMAVRALKKMELLIDRHMQGLGGQKISATQLGLAQQWKKSGRWQDMGSELFAVTDRTNKISCLSPTHEEAITTMVSLTEHQVSHRRLPIKLYQIGRKFRDEMTPKNGLLRCREFEMKDLYTFDENEEKGKETYLEVCEAYRHFLDELSLQYLQVAGDPGLMGGKLSHEFHIVADVGEDKLIVCSQCKNAVNKNCSDTDVRCDRSDCAKTSNVVSGIEVAHAFLLGYRYSDIFNAKYVDSQFQKRSLFMGCFGIGTTRLLAAAVENLSHSEEIRWPRLIAPHQICIIPQKEGYKSDVTDAIAADLHEDLVSFPHLSMEVVMDDRTRLSIGRRVNDAKKLGYPYVVTVGRPSLEEQQKFECIDVYNERTEYFDRNQLFNKLTNIELLPI